MHAAFSSICSMIPGTQRIDPVQITSTSGFLPKDVLVDQHRQCGVRILRLLIKNIGCCSLKTISMFTRLPPQSTGRTSTGIADLQPLQSWPGQVNGPAPLPGPGGNFKLYKQSLKLLMIFRHRNGFQAGARNIQTPLSNNPAGQVQ